LRYRGAVDNNREDHASQRFGRLLSLYRRPDGSEWGGQDLEDATGGVVTRSYVSNLKKGRIENPGLAKLEAIAGAMGFPPALWFDTEVGDRTPPVALAAALEDGTAREILEEVLRMGQKDRRLLLGIARQISPPG
jgi:transcriptional regulator with XRE-family HTH domain